MTKIIFIAKFIKYLHCNIDCSTHVKCINSPHNNAMYEGGITIILFLQLSHRDCLGSFTQPV